MPRAFTRVLAFVVLSLQLMLAPGAHAQEASAESELAQAMEQTRTAMQALADSSLSDTEKRDLQDLYQNTLNFIQRTQSTYTDLADLGKQIEQAPERIRLARQQLESIQAQTAEELQERYKDRDLAELETLIGDKVSRMFSWQNELTAVNSDLIAAQTRPERTQASVSANQSREQQLSEQIRSLQRQADTPLNTARLAMMRAEQRALQRHNELLRQRLNANSVLQDLAMQQRDLLSRQIADLEAEIQVLQDLIDAKRRTQSERTVSETTEEVLQAGNQQLLREQGTLNRRLSEELLRATNQLGELTRKNILTKQQIDSVTQIESALDQQIGVLEGSVLLSRILHQQKKALPDTRPDLTLTDQIADLRLRQFELNQLRDEMTNPSAYLARLVNQLPEEQRESLRAEFERVVNSRISLVDQLSANINTLLSLAITLQINQRQLEQTSGELRRTIDDQLFWVASNRPLDRSWFLNFPSQALAQLEAMEPVKQLKIIGNTLRDHALWLALIALLVGLYVWRLPHLRQQLRQLHEDVGHFRRDSVRHTPKALLLTAVMIIPVPLVLSGLGLIFTRGEEPAMPGLGQALSQLALAWFMLHLVYRVFDPSGIATLHFRWDQDLVDRLHRLVRRGAWIVLPMVVVVALGETRPEQLIDDVIGRLTLLIGLVLLAVLLGRMMQQSQPLYSSKVLHASASLVLVLAPLAVAGLLAWGYNYTAIKLTDRFIGTLYLIILWMLVEGSVMRNLNVAGRRLAYQRSLNKRQAPQPRESVDSEVSVEIPEMDIQQINQQSLRLARMGLVILFGVLVYFTWSDLISAASYLQSVTLWEYNAGTAEAPVMAPITAGDMLGALVIIVLMLSLARNLPGLLEIMVLSRMDLRQGSSYAITTLLSYVIVGVGLFSALSTLGVSWSKLQWLVAALGVGLGFGLQEIFANFVSGLIILFERPVRIGDVVTIGNLSGTVNRIRIRATTITDFDRKEIIVPNKTFVTNQLINWSLNDTITRVTVIVGVAYGSDLEKVRELLLNISDSNPRVLKDPAPMVLFLSFGDSTLNHELRIHVKELIDRNLSIDEINREIDRQFREHGIEIAFRQMDINLRNSEGLERLIVSKRIEGQQPSA
ncbi:potassium efflux system protein [Halopseudomonas xinjiangensis]|uniref:Potassium efflux system protein n=1 Tax=Halopseudomonas xinjiangensis TaxID=487184 RepID=A0A1H1VRD3_9GAMM|nr:mechanosensitive channel MscK [Halopseudomonas xinjiangensis]SDS87040.1 potassium efflux system protein [Halopseudomonas xinjiangensis]